MTPSMNILFYSPSCRFCSEAVRRADALRQQQQQRALAPGEKKLVLVSVDNPAHKARLPPFVDRVPLLYTADRLVLVEDRLLAFLDAQLAEGASAQQDPMAIEGGNDAAYSWLDQGGGASPQHQHQNQHQHQHQQAAAAASLRNPFMSVAKLEGAQDMLSGLPPGAVASARAPSANMHMNVRQQAAGRPGDPPPELPDHMKPMVVSRGRSGDPNTQLSIDAIMAAREMDLQQRW